MRRRCPLVDVFIKCLQKVCAVDIHDGEESECERARLLWRPAQGAPRLNPNERFSEWMGGGRGEPLSQEGEYRSRSKHSK